MYAWLWRTLPGGTALKAAQTVLCGIAVLALLLLVVFPWASHHVPFLRVTVEDPAGSTSTAQPGGSPATQSGALGAVDRHHAVDEEVVDDRIDAWRTVAVGGVAIGISPTHQDAVFQLSRQRL